MSAVTPIPRLPHLETRRQVSQLRVLRSEWTKFRSVRSTAWSLLLGVLLTIAFPILFAAVTSARWGHMSPQEQASRSPLDIALAGVNVAQLAIAVLGVLVITAEYSTGMIRASFTAVPERLPVLWAKIADYAVVSFVLMVPAVLIGFFASQAILARHDLLQISISQPGVARSLVGGAVYVTLVGIFALGIGAIVRNTAGGIATFAGLMFVLPPLMNVLPSSWNAAASPYLPLQAGEAVMALHRGNQLAPWVGLGIFAAYAAAAIAIAAVLLARRDT
ncbi:MAG TPA: hypothetical protein VKC62_00720 [Gaiellaceae bacterium]|nr:hypothetical protein [Gaiellaceae bacterium]